MSFVTTARLALFGLAVALGGCHSATVYSEPPPADYRLRHPIVVGARGAYVPSECGQWPEDLGPGPGNPNIENRPNWNHGCATQHNLAAIVANPNDLLHPRAETPPDATRRQTAIGRYRRGDAPGPQTIHQPIQPLTDIKSAVRGGG